MLTGLTSSLCFAVRSVKNQPSYFADRLYKAMKVFLHNVWHVFLLEEALLVTWAVQHNLIYALQGLGTDDRALIRIMVSRSETDLFNIRKEFKETHDASLHEFIQVETMIVSPSPCLLTLVWRVFFFFGWSSCVTCVLDFCVLPRSIVCAGVAHPFSVAAVRCWGTASWGDWRVCSECVAL